MGSSSLLQGIFPTQGSNPGLLHCRRILYSIYTYNGLLLSHDKVRNFAICNNTDGLEGATLTEISQLEKEIVHVVT